MLRKSGSRGTFFTFWGKGFFEHPECGGCPTFRTVTLQKRPPHEIPTRTPHRRHARHPPRKGGHHSNLHGLHRLGYRLHGQPCPGQYLLHTCHELECLALHPGQNLFDLERRGRCGDRRLSAHPRFLERLDPGQWNRLRWFQFQCIQTHQSDKSAGERRAGSLGRE